MSLLGDRLREAREHLGWTQHEAAEVAGLNYNTIMRWELGHLVPRRHQVMGMAYLYGRPLGWFYDDDSEYQSALYRDPLTERLWKLFQVLRQGSAHTGLSLEEVFGLDPLEGLERVGSGAVPLDPYPLAAGAGAEVLDESRVDHVQLDPRWLRSRALRPDLCDIISVTGDSMEPTLGDGCSILVDRGSNEPRDGRIFVLQTPDGLMVKRLRDESGRWMLVSDNPTWAPVEMGADATLIGEVRWAGSNL